MDIATQNVNLLLFSQPPTKSPLKFLSIELKSPGKIEALW